MKIGKIVSGGQTGADRAALDAARALGIPHGGWCPKGRRAEDGPIPACYQLQETESAHYPVRTRKNVEDSDWTILFSHGPLTGGSLLTLDFAHAAQKPCVHIDLSLNFAPLIEKRPATLADFQSREQVGFPLAEGPLVIVNVAGPRASNDPAISGAVYSAMTTLLS